ncbi:MAG: hypothetical protein U1E36_05580 [Rickettsiales bacterium]
MKTSFVLMMGLIGAAPLALDAHAGNHVSFGYSQSVTTYDTPPVVYNAPAPVVYNSGVQPYCREYNGQVIVGGRYQQSYGTACMQPDGAWQIQTPNGVGTPVGYIAPPVVPAQPVGYYSGTTYYPSTYGAPTYYTPPAYNRSSFSVFVGGNDWNRGHGWGGRSFRGPDCDDNRGWGGHRVYRDDWNRGHGWGHGGRHGGGHWR